MPTYSLEQALALIAQAKPFAGHIEDGSFYLKIDTYLPVVCTAIHAGHRLRQELQPNCLLSDTERYFEEDPFTDEMIASQPITLSGCDSRFEYDLNRSMALSTYYKSAWGKSVWKKPLSRKQRDASQQKHNQFYRLYEALISKLESMFSHVIVFDIHSYNHQRIERQTPVFNIGTEQVDAQRWGPVCERFAKELNQIELPNLDVVANTNDVFAGRGYLIAHTNAHFDRTLVLPTEVKKVFMDELNGTAYPLVIDELKLGMKDAFANTSAFFQRKYNRKKRASKADMLSSCIEPGLLKLDNQLYQLGRGISLLAQVNPVNMQSERKRYLSAPNRFQPSFRYRQLTLDPGLFRQQLYRLPLSEINDPGIKQLYSATIDNLASRLDMVASVGTNSFLYNSLRHYGQPSKQDIANAQFILHAAELEEPRGDTVDASSAQRWLTEQAERWQLPCKIGLSSQMAARAMVVNDNPKLLLNRYSDFSQGELSNLAQHELGVHVATTLNARQQPLKLLRLGLPGATFTQEGLAILAEFTSGGMWLSRLKQLAARVLAVDAMVHRHSFVDTCQLLQQHGIDEQQAFSITARAYRGGGFTKDYLYLSGFVAMLRACQQRCLNNLLVGKAGIEHIDILNELVEREVFVMPKPLVALQPDTKKQGELAYLVRSLH